MERGGTGPGGISSERRHLIDRRGGAGPDQRPGMARVVDRNIQALLERRVQDAQSKTREDRIADRITRFTGSLLFVYLHLLYFGGWIVVNLGWTPLRPFDPSFVVLAMLASVEAIFLSTFVLISQNRMQEQADKRADLDLHVSLLAEHEITHLITLVTEMARKMEVDAASDPELRELAQDVAPEKVLDHMEQHERQLEAAEQRGELR